MKGNIVTPSPKKKAKKKKINKKNTNKNKPTNYYFEALGHIFKNIFIPLVINFVPYVSSLPMQSFEVESFTEN